MKLFFRLLKLSLNQRFGLSALRAGLREDRKRTVLRGLVYVVALLSIGMLIGMYTWLGASVMPAFQALNMEHVLLGLVLLVAMAFVFFMGMFYLIGMLFFSKDTEFLAALPIPHRTVFAAKFSQVLMGETGTTILLLAPLFIVYGISTGAGALFWARAVIVTLLAPCVPLALSGLLSLALMRFSALWRRRELMTIIGSVLLLVAVMTVQMLLTSKLPESMTQEAALALVASGEGLLTMIASVFPPSGWATQGLMGDGGMLLLFVAVSILSLLAVGWIAGRIYYGGASAQLETAAKRRRVALSGKTVRGRSAMRALFFREWRLVLRSPVYAMNGLTAILVGPLLLIMPLFAKGSSSGDEMEMLLSLVRGAADPSTVVMLLAGLFCLVGMINPAMSTSMSREGKAFYMLRLIPITPGKQVLGKLLFGLSVSWLVMLSMGAVAVLGLKLPPLLVLGGFVLGVCVSVCPIALSFLPDVLRPKLTWNSETEAIKQNINGVLGMLIGWLYVAAVGAVCVVAIGQGVSTALLLWCVVAVSAILGGAGLLALRKAAARSFRAIEG